MSYVQVTGSTAIHDPYQSVSGCQPGPVRRVDREMAYSRCPFKSGSHVIGTQLATGMEIKVEPDLRSRSKTEVRYVISAFRISIAFIEFVVNSQLG